LKQNIDRVELDTALFSYDNSTTAFVLRNALRRLKKTIEFNEKKLLFKKIGVLARRLGKLDLHSKK